MTEEIMVLDEAVIPFIEKWKTLTVANDAEMDEAGVCQIDIRKALKRAEAARKELVKPLNDHVKMINAKCKDAIQPLREADGHIEAVVRHYRAEVAAKREEEEKQIRSGEIEGLQNMSTGEIEPPTAPVKSKVESTQGKITYRKVPKWKLEDIKKVPAEYLMLDEVKVGKVTRAGIEIPGIKTWIEEVSQVR